jgi:hypothetical protein
MSAIIEPMLGGAIGCFGGGLFTYVILKRTMSDEKICQKLHMLLEEVAENPEMHEKIYLIGGVLGKGLRDGIGIEKLIPKRKGGLEGIIMDLVGSFIGDRLKKAVPGAETGMQIIEPGKNKEWG